jgi:predicted adenylyl cyclase CyaB
MRVNIEIKARVNELGQLRRLVEALSDAPCEAIWQEDTFFCTPRGRLKLRVLAPDRGELIFYERANVAGPKRSHYCISTSTDPESLKALLSAALGVRGVVRKQRLLYKVGNTRIHVDDVVGLGVFLELEVVLDAGQAPEAGESIVEELLRKLGIEKAALVEGAYIDLLESHATDPPAGEGECEARGLN